MLSKKILTLKRATKFFLDEITGKKPYLGNKYHCLGCGTKLEYFKPFNVDYLKTLEKFDFVYSLFSSETLNWEKYECPHCGINDRDRLYILYLKKKFEGKNISQPLHFIDFAPSDGLRGYLKQLRYVNYRSADITPDFADDQVDITNMVIYEDNKFDAFVCSHVMEHVKDDRKGYNELYRVLKPGGWGILMVPINLHIKEDHEDDSIVTEADRWKYYGQHDHVRMYSKNGFLKKVTEAGFKVNQLGIDHFGAEDFQKYGIHYKSVLYIVEK